MKAGLVSLLLPTRRKTGFPDRGGLAINEQSTVDSSSLNPSEVAGDSGEGSGSVLREPESAARLSVVICAYTVERWEDIVAAIQSLLTQTIAPHEVILVVDYNQELLERARSLHGVRSLPNSRAQGASGARNTGIEAARGNIIAFLDDDAVAEPDWLEMLLHGYEEPNVAGVGGSIIPAWPESSPAWFPEEFGWVVGCTYEGMPANSARVRNVIGANMSVRKDVLDRAGGFREGYGNVKAPGAKSWAGESRASSCEDTEFCVRASSVCSGLEWLYEPRARVHHRVPEHRCTLRYFLSRSREEGLAKARLAGVVGSRSALGVEGSYVLRTLTRAIVRSAAEGARSRDANAMKRLAAIVAGFIATAAGYLEGLVRNAA